MRCRCVTPALLLLVALLAAAPARAQDWRPVEVEVQEAMVNQALARAHEAAIDARRDAPEPEPESLGEALKSLAAAFMHVGRPRLTLHDGRVVLQATVHVEAIFDRTSIDVDFDLAPRVTSPNVVELTVLRGRERWRGRDWEEKVGRDLTRNVRSLVDAMGSAGGAAARLEGGEAPRIVVDLTGVPALAGVQLTDLTVRQGAITAAGRTTRDGVTMAFSPSDVGDAIRKLAGSSEVLSWDAWVDLGRETPGHVTLHSTADLPWLPALSYRATFKVEAAGPHRLRLTFAGLELGGSFTNGFLSRTGIKNWIINRLYARLDGLEAPTNAAYDRGESDVRLSHDPRRPEVRLIDLRPGWAGDATVRPGFALDTIDVQPGRVTVSARLLPEPTTADARRAPPRSVGLANALGAIGE